MAEYRLFPGSSRSVLLEVGPDSGGGGGGGLTELFGAITQIAGACADALARLPEQKRPGEIKLAFGLRALDDGSLAVALDPAAANFAVTLTWSGGGSAAAVVGGLTKPPAA